MINFSGGYQWAIPKLQLSPTVLPMAEYYSKPSAEADDSQESQPELSAGFDRYQSMVDSNLMIFVAKDVVPPFRFKAGGWELLQSSIELGWR